MHTLSPRPLCQNWGWDVSDTLDEMMVEYGFAGE